MESCPSCSSADIVVVELGENSADDLFECEGCETQFNGDEMVGFEED